MTDCPRKLVESFYFDVWNRRDEDAAHRILASSLQFRGSLGIAAHGISGFLEYVDLIHSALGDYRCEFDELIASGTRAAAKMTFRGRHRGAFLGVPPTHRVIAWNGAAFFTICGGQICDIWVLGDTEALKAQLGFEAGQALDPARTMRIH